MPRLLYLVTFSFLQANGGLTDRSEDLTARLLSLQIQNVDHLMSHKADLTQKHGDRPADFQWKD